MQERPKTRFMNEMQDEQFQIFRRMPGRGVTSLWGKTGMCVILVCLFLGIICHSSLIRFADDEPSFFRNVRITNKTCLRLIN